MVKTSSIAALSVLLNTSLPSQAHPDFIGRWVLESSSPAAADVPRALAVRQSLVSTNLRGEAMTPFFKDLITIEREVGGRRRSETYNIGVLGGG